MTMYASQKINQDPQPFQVFTRGVTGDGYYAGVRSESPRDDGKVFTQYAPRDYYDNNPNPILLQFRASTSTLIDSQRHIPHAAAHWLWLLKADPQMEDTNYWGDDAGKATAEHVEHAEKVLGLLAGVVRC